MKTYRLIVLLFVFLIASGAAGPKAPSTDKFSITTRLDKTAIWVGDTLAYTVQVIHDRDVEFILDNLKKEDLPLAPFVVRDLRLWQGDWQGNKKVVEIILFLNSYETGKTELIIPAFNLYYFRRGAVVTKGDASAEAVQIPATRVAARSTLNPAQLKLRDFRPAPPLDLKWAIAALTLALLGTTFLVVRAIKRTRYLLHARRPQRKRTGRLAGNRALRERLARLRAISKDSPDDPIRFYRELSLFMRQYLGERLDLDALGLTSEEIEAALKKAGREPAWAEQIRIILEKCDRAQYGKADHRSDQGSRDQLFATVERVVHSARSKRTSYGLHPA